MITHNLFGDLRTPKFVLYRSVIATLYMFDPLQLDWNKLDSFLTNMMNYVLQRTAFALELLVYISHHGRVLSAQKTILFDITRRLLINPYDKMLRVDSSRFLPTTILLYNLVLLQQEYCNFLEWKQATEKELYAAQTSTISHSFILSEQIKTRLTDLIENNKFKQISLDTSVLILIQLYDYDNQLKVSSMDCVLFN